MSRNAGFSNRPLHRRGHKLTEEAVARSSFLFGAVICALTAANAALVASSAPASDAPLWNADRRAAFSKAADERKLVLAINLAGDFLADPSTSPEVLFYRSLAMSDRRVAELIASRFIVTAGHCGPSAALQTSPAKGERPATPNDFAIAFVCLPNQRVLHFVPGLVSADMLLADLQWADDCNRDRLTHSPGDSEWFVRQRHFAASLPAHRRAFYERRQSRWLADAPAPAAGSHEDFITVVRAARTARDQMLTERMKANWNTENLQRTLLTALASHGELEAGIAHGVLAEYPLPRLSEIERPLYEIVSGQRFWQRPAGGAAIMQWWDDVGSRGQTSLLVTGHDPFYGPEVRSQQPLVLPALLAALPADRRQVAARAVTLEELAVLVTEAKLEPIRFTPKDGPPRFVVFDSRGFLLCKLSPGEATVQRLSQALRDTSKAGDLATAGSAEGDTDDKE